MKNIRFSIAIITFLLASCFSGSPSTGEIQSEGEYEEVYINQFRLTYFRNLLAKSYNHSDAVAEIISNDHSGFAEPILNSEDYRIIDSLTNLDLQYLVKNSLASVHRAEGSRGKRPLGFIMDKLRSSWLDSLAEERLKLNGIPEDWKE